MIASPSTLGESSRVQLTALKVNQADGAAGAQGTTLVLDGQVQTPIMNGDRIAIARHPRTVRFVQNPASDYWSRLIGKLNWSVAPKLA